jgi:hypothetical protein
MAVALPVFEAIARSAGHASCAIAPTMSLDLEISTINAQAAQAAP